MNSNINYFIGKICSVFATHNNRDLKAEDTENYPASYLRYFLGVVESIDEDGLLLTQASKGLKVFIMKNHIVAIAEEEVLNPESPADAKIIESAFEYTEELKQKKEEIREEVSEMFPNHNIDKTVHAEAPPEGVNLFSVIGTVDAPKSPTIFELTQEERNHRLAQLAAERKRKIAVGILETG